MSIETTAATVPLDCSGTTAARYDVIGSMHTVLPYNQPVTAIITPVGDAWCTGGHGAATVTLTNTGQATEHVHDPRLVLNGGASKWTLQEWPPFDLAPGGTQRFDASFTVPDVNPRTYELIVYGYDGLVEVNVEGPPACTTADLAATASPSGGAAMGHYETYLTITNVGDHPCLLPGVDDISVLDAAGAESHVAFTRGAFFGDPAPLASHVLPVGGQAVMNLETMTACLEGTEVPVPWSGLRLRSSGATFGDILLDVAVDIFTTCGLKISSYGRAENG